MRDMYPQANGGPRGKLGAFADGTPGGVHKEAEMSAPAGWHPDPYGRFSKRYWDGQQWTEHVVTGDERQQVDPMGTSTAIPFATPESAQTTRRQPDGDGSASPGHGFAATSSAVDPGGAPATAPARPDGGGFWGLLARMAPDSRTRPDPTLPIVLSGLGGVLAGGGIAALVIGDSSTRAKVVIAGVVITALCLVVRLSVPRPAEVRSAAIGGGIVGLAVLAAGIVGDGFTDNDWVPAAVIAALFLAAWALPGFFGRTVMLGIGTFAVVAAVAAAIDNDPVDPDARSVNVDVPFFDRIGNQGYVFMVLGAALMGLWPLVAAADQGVPRSGDLFTLWDDMQDGERAERKRRRQLAGAALSGLGLVPVADLPRSARVEPEANAYVQRLREAAQSRRRGEVILLSAAGLGKDAAGVRPDYLHEITRALTAVGLRREAGLIAAEILIRNGA